MNPFARALLAFHAGDPAAAFVIRRDDGFQQRVPASLFFASDNFPPLEARAMDLCRGRILDIGAAAGRHSLELRRRGADVSSLDVLPETEGIMRDRGLKEIFAADIFAFSGERFDTLLMLMNGIGMTGTVDRLQAFLRRAHDIILPGGRILCDSIDVTVTSDPIHVAYRQRNTDSGRPPGQQSYRMSFEEDGWVDFDWLHIDFPSLSKLCQATAWKAHLIGSEPDGHYLCELAEEQ